MLLNELDKFDVVENKSPYTDLMSDLPLLFCTIKH